MIADLAAGPTAYWASVLAPAYLLGSIPSGLILGRLAGVGDVRQHGSGNIGATNVLRTGRVGLAALTLLLDAGKGALAVALADRLGPGPAGWAALAVVLGHMFPVWLRFRGGKGVATTFGALAALAWPVALASGLAWVALVAIFRRSSVGALGALVAVAPGWLWGLLALQRAGILPLELPGDPVHLPVLLVIALLIALRHHANVRRLVLGTEPVIGFRRTEAAPTATRTGTGPGAFPSTRPPDPRPTGRGRDQ